MSNHESGCEDEQPINRDITKWRNEQNSKLIKANREREKSAAMQQESYEKTMRDTQCLDRAAAWEERKRQERVARARGMTEFERRSRARAMRRFWGLYFAFCAAVVTLAIIYRAEIISALGF